MEKLVSWKKGFFSSTYQFYSNGIQIGFLKIGVWVNKANGVLNDKGFEFKTKGFFKQETIITDTKMNIVVGTITYNAWKSKALIKLTDGTECNWAYTNFWRTKWSLSKNLYFINYQGLNTKGDIVSYLSDDLLIISGLFISNHFWQSRAAVAAT
mgnify:FL=1